MGGRPIQIDYYLSDSRHPVTIDGPLWKSALPRGRKDAAGSGRTPSGRGMSYGHLFESVRRFVKKNRCGALLAAAESQWGRRFDYREIEQIHIFLEKHGAYYHPARVEAVIAAKTTTVVVNVAVSRAGLACIPREAAALSRLADEGGAPWLPRVFGRHQIPIEPQNTPLGLFMAQWLEGFHEFHITARTGHQGRGIVIWDPSPGNRLLAPDMARQLFARAAEILTRLYNLETFEQVLAWHHAAGDFVVRMKNSDIDVKLISVRSYGPLIETDDRDPVTILQALLLFLINLSIRMRLDRFDGVGKIAWIGDWALESAVLGFFCALSAKAATPFLPDTPLKSFLYYISTFSRDELHRECSGVLAAYAPQSPEKPVIAQHLQAHATKLHAACQEWIPPTT